MLLLWTGLPAPAAAAPTAQEQAAISQVNFRRGLIGLPPLGYNSYLEQSSRAHAGYLATHDATGHVETSGLAGFTGITAFDRISATSYGAPWASNEVISFGASTGVDAIEGLIQAIYHRFGLFSTSANEIGVGAVTNHPSFGTVFVVNSARQFAPPPGPGSGWVGVYPYDGQTGVTRDFLSDSESPDPVSGSNRVGYPISIHVDDGRVLSVTSFTVAPVGSAALSVQLLTAATDPNNETPVSAAALIPLAPLAYGTEYEASFAGTVDGTPLTKTWRFTTTPLLPITFSPAQPYLGYNSTLDIEIYGGSGVYTAFISYFEPKPADLAFIGSHTVKLTSPAASVGAPVTGSITLTVNDNEGNTGQVVIQVQPAVDSTPDAFSFPAVTSAALSTVVQSASITVTGIDVPAAISIQGGEYSINAAAFTSQAGTVVSGDTVRVRLTSSALDTTLASATLTIGGVSAAFNVTTGGLDTVAPSVPAGLSATTISSSQIDLAWNASSDNVAVTAYPVFRDGVFRDTVTGATNFTDSGLAGSTTYSYTVAACDGSGNCSLQSAPPVSATTLTATAGFTPLLRRGWNLLGNSLEVTLSVATVFGSPGAPVTDVTSHVNSIWKWNATLGVWQFYAPSLTAQENLDYADLNGFEVLTSIEPGYGYWVNLKNTAPAGGVTLPVQTGAPVVYEAADPIGGTPAKIAGRNLVTGWQLVAIADAHTPSQFNENLSGTPLQEGVVKLSFQSLWAWDALLGTWYFYAPQLHKDGEEQNVGLALVQQYALDNGFLHFEDYTKTLGVGTGFWLRK